MKDSIDLELSLWISAWSKGDVQVTQRIPVKDRPTQSEYRTWVGDVTLQVPRSRLNIDVLNEQDVDVALKLSKIEYLNDKLNQQHQDIERTKDEIKSLMSLPAPEEFEEL